MLASCSSFVLQEMPLPYCHEEWDSPPAVVTHSTTSRTFLRRGRRARLAAAPPPTPPPVIILPEALPIAATSVPIRPV